MRPLTAALLAALALGQAPAALGAGHEWHGRNEASAAYADALGDTRLGIDTPGFTWQDRLEADGRGPLAGAWEYSLSAGGNATNDRRLDPQDGSLTRLNLTLSDPTTRLSGGDVFESFSQYSLGSPLKGAAFRREDLGGWLPGVALVYGDAYARWDDAWYGRAPRRQALGGRAFKTLAGALDLGVNAVRSLDVSWDPYSLPQDNRNFSADWQARPLPGLRIDGEAAYAQTLRPATAFDPGAEDHGHAERLAVTGDQDPSRVTLEYERVSPGYSSALGAATADRERAKARWRYKATRDVWATTGLLWYRNNLDARLAEGFQYWKPELALSLFRVLGDPDATVEASYRPTAGRVGERAVGEQAANLGLRNRLLGLDSDASFAYSQAESGALQQFKQYTYNGGLSGRFALGPLVLRPRASGGGWTSRDELSATQERTWNYTAGLGLDAPDAGAHATLSGGQTRQLRGDAWAMSRDQGSLDLDWRPGWTGALQATLFARAELQTTTYAAGNWIQESKATLGLNTQY